MPPLVALSPLPLSFPLRSYYTYDILTIASASIPTPAEDPLPETIGSFVPQDNWAESIPEGAQEEVTKHLAMVEFISLTTNNPAETQ